MMEVREQDIAVLENEHLDHYWPDIARSLEQTRDVWEDTYTIDGLYTEAIAKRCQVWVVGVPTRWDLVVFTDVVETHIGRSLRVFLTIGKNFDDYLALIDGTLERFAVMAECSNVRIIGREGWKRKLKPIGFSVDSVTLTRPVRGQLNG